jgi:hypothetical protein
MCPRSGRLLSLMNPTGNLNNESFHFADGKMRIQRLCPEGLNLKMGGNRRRGLRPQYSLRHNKFQIDVKYKLLGALVLIVFL